MSLQQPPHPIFLVSVARSGTNLFMHLFSEHPQIVPKDYSFFNAYLFGPENQRGKEVTESDNPSGIPVGGSLLDETFQKAYERLESSIFSIIQDESSSETVLFKDHSQMLLKTSSFLSQKPNWASPSPKIAKPIESVTSSNPALSNMLPSPAGTVRNPTYLPDAFLGLFSPVILIRHPAILVPSFYRAILKESENQNFDRLYEWEVHGSQTSPNAQWALWEWYNERADLAEARASQTKKEAGNGSVEHLSEFDGTVVNHTHLRPIVIDMDLDLLTQPAETIDLLTQSLSLDPAEIIHSWSPTASASDHPGMTAWKGTLLNSAGMMPPKIVSGDIRGVEAKTWEAEWGKDVSEALMKWVDQHLGLYEELKGKRTRIVER